MDAFDDLQIEEFIHEYGDYEGIFLDEDDNEQNFFDYLKSNIDY